MVEAAKRRMAFCSMEFVSSSRISLSDPPTVRRPNVVILWVIKGTGGHQQREYRLSDDTEKLIADMSSILPTQKRFED